MLLLWLVLWTVKGQAAEPGAVGLWPHAQTPVKRAPHPFGIAEPADMGDLID